MLSCKLVSDGINDGPFFALIDLIYGSYPHTANVRLDFGIDKNHAVPCVRSYGHWWRGQGFGLPGLSGFKFAEMTLVNGGLDMQIFSTACGIIIACTHICDITGLNILSDWLARYFVELAPTSTIWR